MARHGENIRRRKDGRWEGRYKIGNDERGRTVYRSVYGQTYAEVKKKQKEHENNYTQNSLVPTINKTFSFVLDAWFSTVKADLKKSTIHKYQNLITQHILPQLGNIPIAQLDVNMIRSFTEKKLESGSLNQDGGLSKSYVRSILLIISAAVDYAAQEGWCKSISSKIHKPVPDKTELKILTDSEQQCLEKRLIEQLSPTTIGILITLKTGLRIGEICALRWDDFDFTNKILYVHATVARIKNPAGTGTILIIDTPKTQTSLRAIPLTDELTRILLQFKAHSTSCYVVSDQKDFLSPRTFEYRYHRFMEQFSFQKLNYHALRHSFATRCIEYGVDIKSLSEILGHANVSITLNTYVHSSMSLKRAQLEKLPALSA